MKTAFDAFALVLNFRIRCKKHIHLTPKKMKVVCEPRLFPIFPFTSAREIAWETMPLCTLPLSVAECVGIHLHDGIINPVKQSSLE